MHTHRDHTNLTEQIPESERKRYATFLIIDGDGTYTLRQEYTDALQQADDDKNNYLAHQK